MYKLIASFLGVGYVKGGASAASAITCILIWFVWHTMTANTLNFVLLFITLIVIIIGIFVSNKAETYWGHDSHRIVIDEVAGMLITMLFIPVNNYLLLTGFVTFRILDNIKPLFIKKTERLPGGLGVMMDDVLAGFYSNIFLWIIYTIFIR